MRLVALVGFKGSGKDTAGNYLVDQYGYIPFSFAESLKDALASIFCWPRDMLEGATPESREWRETVDEWWAEKLDIPNFTPRFAMQNVGTDVFREHFHPDIWILNIERKITLLGPNANVVLKDGRFPNELGLVRKFNGQILRVKRGPEPVWFETAEQAAAKDWLALEKMANVYKVHQSEWAWIGSPIDHVLENDGTIPELHSQVFTYCNLANHEHFSIP